MWESREQKEKYYRQMYGGWSNEVIQLTDAQIKHLEDFKKSKDVNPCLEIPLGIGKYTMGFDPYTEEIENYKLLLL